MEHRAGHPQLLRPQREIDVRHDQRDHRHRAQAVDRIDRSPTASRPANTDCAARTACRSCSASAARSPRSPAPRPRPAMWKALLQRRILGIALRRRPAQPQSHARRSAMSSRRSRGPGTIDQKSCHSTARTMWNRISRRQHDPGDPVRRHPFELPAEDRQERGEQAGQQRRRHRPSDTGGRPGDAAAPAHRSRASAPTDCVPADLASAFTAACTTMKAAPAADEPPDQVPRGARPARSGHRRCVA